MRVMRGFNSHDVAACFDEPNTTGAVDDFDAPRNAPAKYPHLYLDKVYWHSAFTQHELALGPIAQSVSHTLLNSAVNYYNVATSAGFGGTPVSSPGAVSGIWYGVRGARRVTDIEVYTHGLGYKPHFVVSAGNGVIGSGTLVQRTAQSHRSITPYVTNTKLIFREVCFADEVNLSAGSVTYGLLFFRQPAQDPDKALFGKIGSHVQLGRGRIDSQYKYLRESLPAESSVDLNLGHTIEYALGGSKQVIGDVSSVHGNFIGDFSGTDFLAVDVSQ